LYPLPWPEAQGGLFQSKCTPAQYLEKYEVRANGELWFLKTEREYIEDDSSPLGISATITNQEWVRENLTGEVELHALRRVAGINYWYSIQFWFRDGIVRDAVFRKYESSNQSSLADEWPCQMV
jgi:hypothetical protein